MSIESITSVQNPKIKEFLLLQEKSKERREKGLFVIEGRREVLAAYQNGFEFESLLIYPELLDQDSGFASLVDEIISQSSNIKVFSVSRYVYEKIAYRGGTEGIVAIAKSVEKNINELQMGVNPLILVLESVEKPGNLGAVLRTADAAAIDAVIICDPLTDLYNPNLIRASLGAIFTKQVVACTSQNAISWLKSNNIQILTAQLQDSKVYYDADMTIPTSIVFGSESGGLTNVWRDASDGKILIPMLGHLDSLNISVSAAILCFEAIRQRAL